GAIDSTVSSAISWIERSVTPPLPWPRLMLMSCANAGSASEPAAIRMAKNNTLRGKVADLTKETSDGPARRPSRLPDSQTRSSARPSRPAARPSVRCEARGGAAAARVRPAGRRPEARWHRAAGEALLPAAAPFRRDFDRRSTATERPQVRAAAPAPGEAAAARRRPDARCESAAAPSGPPVAAPLGVRILDVLGV